MVEKSVEDLLNQLNSPNPQEAWSEFLNDYSALIYQVIRHFEADLDKAGDCFQFVCERFIENKSRRLRQFKGTGQATFTTWLRAVVRNLCIDWHRKEFGRQRPFRAISRLSAFDQEVFKLVYERGVSADETLTLLTAGFPNVTESRLAQSKERIETVLTPNQRWLLTQRARQVQMDCLNEQTENLAFSLEDPRPNPEAQADLNERMKKLEKAMASLTYGDQLLIRLRFEQGLTLDQAAKLLGLGNAQRADRRLREVLAKLRQQLP